MSRALDDWRRVPPAHLGAMSEMSYYRAVTEEAERRGVPERDLPALLLLEALEAQYRPASPFHEEAMRDETRPTPTGHPAPFSMPIMDVLYERVMAAGCQMVLDPFAGTGRVHMVAETIGITSVGIELEPEWANLHPKTRVGSALALPFADSAFDGIVTSPTYGNTMAQHHDQSEADESTRFTYKHSLGRDPSEGSSAVLFWGPEYRSFHLAAWAEALRVLKPGGYFFLNVKDHVKDRERVHVSAWHVAALSRMGLVLAEQWEIPRVGIDFGLVAESRVPYEFVYVFRRPLLGRNV
jgi:SAM-dependent methyltransferase